MKVYLLYTTIEVIPKVVGVYTTLELATEQVLDGYDYIVETYTDIEPNQFLPYPELTEGN